MDITEATTQVVGVLRDAGLLVEDIGSGVHNVYVTEDGRNTTDEDYLATVTITRTP